MKFIVVIHVFFFCSVELVPPGLWVALSQTGHGHNPLGSLFRMFCGWLFWLFFSRAAACLLLSVLPSPHIKLPTATSDNRRRKRKCSEKKREKKNNEQQYRKQYNSAIGMCSIHLCIVAWHTYSLNLLIFFSPSLSVALGFCCCYLIVVVCCHSFMAVVTAPMILLSVCIQHTINTILHSILSRSRYVLHAWT